MSKIQAKIGTVMNIRLMFSSETEVLSGSKGNCQMVESEQPRNVDCADGILYYGLWFMDKIQFKLAGFDFILLDCIPFPDVHELVGNLPLVLSDSLILYGYIMIIHLSRIQQDGVNITVKPVSDKMFVLEKLCRNNYRSPGEEGIHIALSTDVARVRIPRESYCMETWDGRGIY